MSEPELDIDALWDAYDANPCAETTDPLFRQYAPLAGYLARRALAKAPPYQDAEDIYSYAHHGLLDAIAKFDRGAGVKFETYATRRVAGAIIDGQRRQDPLARGTRKKVKQLEAAQAEHWEETSQDATLEELAERMGESVDVVRQVLLAQKSLNGSLDIENSAIDSRGIHSDAEVEVELAELAEVLGERLAQLSGREVAFVLAHYVDGASGIHRTWDGQTRKRVLAALRG